MSIPVFEKIELIRQSAGLTQNEFAERVGVSVNTLIAVKSRGSSPRFDVLEKICEVWPEYGLWLITGETEPLAGQYEPGRKGSNKIAYQIIDSVDARNLDHMIVSSKHVKEVIFLQSVGDDFFVPFADEKIAIETSRQVNRKYNAAEKKTFAFGIAQSFGTAILLVLSKRENREFSRAVLVKDDSFDLKESISNVAKSITFLAVQNWFKEAGINKFDIATVHYKTLRILESESDELKLSDIYPSADDDAIKSLIEWRKSFK